MNRISIEEALQIAEEYFPNGIEEIVKKLAISIDYENIGGSDGYVIKFNENWYITINESHAKVRQRFTLAHELAHVLLGITPIVGEDIDIFSLRDSDEENKVNELASALLIPTSKIIRRFSEIPISMEHIRKFAADINVSVPTVASRVVALARNIGLDGAMVIFYQDGQFEYFKRTDDEMFKLGNNHKKSAEGILKKCIENYPQPYKLQMQNGEVAYGTVWENTGFKTKVIFIQVVDEKTAGRVSIDVRIKELRNELFNNNIELFRAFNGKLGSFNKPSRQYSVDQAVEVFYRERLFREYENPIIDSNKELLRSTEAVEYVRLTLTWWRKNGKIEN